MYICLKELQKQTDISVIRPEEKQRGRIYPSMVQKGFKLKLNIISQNV